MAAHHLAAWPAEAAPSPEQRAMRAALQALTADAPLPWRVLQLEVPATLHADALQAALAALWPAHAQCALSALPRLQQVDLPALLQPAAQPGEGLRVSLAAGRLLLAAHPLWADAGSLLALAQQLADVCAGVPAPQADSLFQYPAYAEWRQALAEGEDAASGRAYWQQAMAGTETWPAANPAQRGDAWAEHTAVATLSATQSDAITAAAGSAGLSPCDWLQAAWWSLLLRLAGFEPRLAHWQHDCREDYDVMQGAVGLFDKPLPLRLDARADESFASWLPRWQAAAAAHLAAQEYWPVQAPPSQVHLAAGFAGHTLSALAGGWHVQALQGNWPGSTLGLQVLWSPAAVQLTVRAQAACDAQVLLAQCQAWIAALLSQPATALAELNPLSVADQQAHAALQGPPAAPCTQGVDALWAHWAEHTPNAPAIEADGSQLSYVELATQVRQAALAMAQTMSAAAPGVPRLVALALPRSPALLIAMLAAWQAGAAYLPLDPEWPAARHAAVLAEARPALLVSDTPQPDAACPVTSWAALIATPESAVALPPACHSQRQPQDLAYVLYTSGSTGRPKGVTISHGALRHYVAGVAQALDLAGPQRWALTGTVAADLGNTALFGALCHGGCLVIATPEQMQDAAHFARFLDAGRITALKIVPSHLQALLEGEQPLLPARIVLGGEPAPRALLARIAALAPATRVANHYGPTEATVGVMVHACLPGAPWPERLPLSQVLAGSVVRVLDRQRRPVPIGVVGELFIGGAQLCDGYLNRPELNLLDGPDSVFITDPLQPGQRLYRSGDLACLLPEGGLRLLGRADDQLKIRGFRVEPGETEAALRAQAGVRQAAVLGLADATGQTVLAAFVVAEAGVTANSLREALATALPAPLLPAQCHLLATLPRLANGKLDRQALAAMARQPEAAPAAPQRAPRDAVEALLAAGMGELLGRGALGVEDDFFDHGGHSLLVIRLVARLRKQLAVEVPPAWVFDHPSAAALAAALQAREDAAALLQRAQALQPA
ncbi:amino acid adenylation domain-containing protein [Ideonella azotifigens]|uniref:Carrier domain-containing protein n=1 Tax=Ideonella azotifigens TaxID=513160 RepID=A0ABP3VFR9_9BURK|nr:non-ribosomal peptide synthetase [Ideonella azotifigens]MCD2343999.1 amino acid adenylation domain-containing protein [Ideonella azotifigens]